MKIAEEFADQLKLSPILIDGIDDSVEKAYASWPDRMSIIDATGKIAHKGAIGPGALRAAPGVLDKSLKGDK